MSRPTSVSYLQVQCPFPPPRDLGQEGVLECVANVSEGRRQQVVEQLARSCGPSLADVHSDPFHHRSVFTLVGPGRQVEEGARSLARAALASVDLNGHTGAHPRTGALDVVPFVALEGWPLADAGPLGRARACRARDSFAAWAARELGLPVFVYGPERSLPEVRRSAWQGLRPTYGPTGPHPSGGAVSAGCRPLLVAYNLWLEEADLDLARRVSAALRGPGVRALGLAVGGGVQVSLNLVSPLEVGPAEAWDRVSALAPVARAELVGLLPFAVLERVPEQRWEQLDLSAERTVEAALNGFGKAARHVPGRA